MNRLNSFILHNSYFKSSVHSSMMRALIILSMIFTSGFGYCQNIPEYREFVGHSNSIVANVFANYYYRNYYPETININAVANINRPLESSEVVGTSFYDYKTGYLNKPEYTHEAFIEFDLKNEGLSQNDINDIVFYLRRLGNNSDEESVPTSFIVMGLFGDDAKDLMENWHQLCYVYFSYRGKYTKEYSARIPIRNLWKKVSDFPENPENVQLDGNRDGKNLKKIRLYVTSNVYNQRIENGYSFHLIEFHSIDIIKIGRNEDYSAIFKDNTHLVDDYFYNFEDFSFRNTRGVIDEPNKIEGWEYPSADDIKRLKDDCKIEFPDFEFITNKTDKKKNKYKLDEGQKRQPTHTEEHIIYALPGDVIDLYPFIGMSGTTCFKENFSHWYNFKTGGRLTYTTPWDGKEIDLLDFLNDAHNMQWTKDNGFYGGKFMNEGNQQPQMPDYIINTPQEYVDMVNEINANSSKNRANIVLGADLDFTGYEVPMLGPTYNQRFRGTLNGNGHKISNLTINMPDEEYVGIISRCTDNAVVMNLIIDKSCTIIGKRIVGPIAYLANKSLTVRNFRSDATIKSMNGLASGILGWAQGNDTFVFFEDCYVGGAIGGNILQTENAAVVGLLETNGNNNKSILKNIIVNCSLFGSDRNPNRKFVRPSQSSQSDDNVIINGDGSKERGIFKYENCYGNLDNNDETWNYIPSLHYLSTENLAKLGWTDYKTPPMSTTVDGISSSSFIKITDEEDYIAKITAFNKGTKLNENFELTQDLDFKNYGPDDVPMIGDFSGVGGGKEFAGVFNGAGHTIRNLKISRDVDMVGMFKATQKNARIENLIIDSSCVFEGKGKVGLIGYHNWDPLVIRNVKTEATVRGSVRNTGGIVGLSDHTWGSNVLTLENVYIGGVVGYADKGTDNGAISGWLSQSNGNVTLTNVVVDCELYSGQNASGKLYIRHDGKTIGSWSEDTYVVDVNDNWKFKYTNCFGNLDLTDEPWQTMDVVTDESKLPEFEDWTDQYTPGHSVKRLASMSKLKEGTGLRIPGTYATFYCPSNPYQDMNQTLPFEDGEDEYVIAADFSQTFDPEKHIDENNKEIIEPIIAFRHIFRIRDGRKQAIEITQNAASNKNYIQKKRKFVTAREGVEFQLRLDNYLAKEVGRHNRSNQYYKVSDNMFSRIVGCYAIKVKNLDTNKVLYVNTTPNRESDRWFYLGQTTERRLRSRSIEGIRYMVGDEDDDDDKEDSQKTSNDSKEFLRMLMWKSPEPGHYLVSILGRNDEGSGAKLIEDLNTDMIIMEYDITILPKEASKLLKHEELYTNNKYKDIRPEELDAKYGNPIKIDFDEYLELNKLSDGDPLKNLISRSTYVQPNSYQSNSGPDSQTTANGMEHTWFKWPVPWGQSTYSFGYDDRQDYNMYQLATHSENVVWKQQAQKFAEATDPSEKTGNKIGDGTGLYDRKYYASRWLNTSETPEQGYFYYVNAATDPGVTASLTIDELCQGSEVVVSAWFAEFSFALEKVNLCINFVAVLKDDVEEIYGDTGFINGERIVLHKYLTGYITYWGDWYNICYSFIPRISAFSSEGVTSDMIDHYELELDNNAKSSNGADYAVDDIRIYIIPPVAAACQASPVCGSEKVKVKLSSPFDTLLEIARKNEGDKDNNENLDVYYTFLDKEIYNATYEESKNHEEAFKKAVVSIKYTDSDTQEKEYGKISFNSYYNNNPAFNLATAVPGTAYSQEDDEGKRMIAFGNDIDQNKLVPGKDYWVVLRTPLELTDIPEGGKEWAYFNMTDKCACKCSVSILPTNFVKLDGVIQADLDNLTVCENQSPVIQVNVSGVNEKGEVKSLEKNVHFDWFHGTMDQFNAYVSSDGNPNHTLKNALSVFRNKYMKMENLDGISKVEDLDKITPDNESSETIEQWMIDIIKKAITPPANGALPILTLYQASYVMPPVDIPSDKTKIVDNVVVIPISSIVYEEKSESDKEYLVCTTPTELTLTIGNKTPILKHGLTDIAYPSALTDVPLRIGIDHLRNEYFEPSRYEKRRIDIPVRLAHSSDGNSQKKLSLIKEKVNTLDNYKNSELKEKEGAVILAQTNDPAYKHLGTLDNEDNEIEALLWVGDIIKLEAKTNQDNSTQYFQVEFDDKNFSFKEGYFYRFRFQFDEERSSEDENVCSGQDVFTVKVVPKYLAWTGENGLNWNDDGNWRRVAGYQNSADAPKNDLELQNITRSNQFAHYITNGLRGITPNIVNPNTKAYAPLDFTHVIVESGMEGPFMYSPSVMREDKVKDEYDSTKKYDWPSDPEKGTAKLQKDDPGADAVGKVTPLIHYDMAAFEFGTTNRRNDAEVGCRPWYANTCNEIHFKPGGTIMNQQELTYNKAWVDIELDHSRWQTVSTPLQEVFAGDFYLPSDGARQKTELYQDITFDNELKKNNRFKPAVFQRGWDKSFANVYELDASENEIEAPRNVAVKTFWSHVYNDVEEPYGGGVGFSIKTDITDMTDANKPNADGKVLFRLPKADTEYLYWNKDGFKSGHKTEITRGSGQYRLNDSKGTITATTANDGNYFLVGNPFMTHMDIQKFLKENESLLEKKYWVITKTGQIAGIVGENEVMSAVPTGTENPTVIPPMQGFFVKSESSAKSLSLVYDETMMRRYDSSDEYLTSTTRADETISALKISSYNYGAPSSAALLLTDGKADAANDVEALDNRDLDILSTVYTAKDGTALSINFCEDAEGTEIGIIADDDTETVIRFEGVEAVDGLYLLDKADRSLTPLEEGMEVAVEGAAAGRFFLTYGIADEGVMNGIEWSVNGGVLTVVDNAASGSLEVNVYDTVGRLLKRDATNMDVLEMTLKHGIYVVEIRTLKEQKSIKIWI